MFSRNNVEVRIFKIVWLNWDVPSIKMNGARSSSLLSHEQDRRPEAVSFTGMFFHKKGEVHQRETESCGLLLLLCYQTMTFTIFVLV